MAKYDAFISYNSREANQVQRIAQWLREQNLQVFLDQWELRPGDKLIKTLGDALSESECCLIMIGENGISPWHENEIYSVLDATIERTMKRVIPVFLPGTHPPEKKTALPWFLRGILYVAFKHSVTEEEHLQEIRFGITGHTKNGQGLEHECPYRGLEVFREEDRKYFYGREALVQQLYSRFEDLDNNRLLAVLGPSGSGKSSVVRAGLIPQLRNEKTLITVFTPGNNPIEQLAYALRALSKPKPRVEEIISRLKHSKEALHLISGELARDQKQDRIILVVDQFEELFTLTEKESRVQQFVDLLIYAVEVASGSTHVILTMRSDFLGRCARFPELNDYMSHHMEHVGLMSVQELRDAIEQPAWKAGLTFEARLVDTILMDVKNAVGKLPLLQFALKELYNQRAGQQLTYSAYQGMGGMEGALAQRADIEYQKLAPEEQKLLQRIFLQGLIHPGEGTEDTRRRATKSELYGAGDNQQVERLIQQWSGPELRLLTVSTDPEQGDVVEVAHEALIRQWDKLTVWMEGNREQLLLRNALRRDSRDWETHQQETSFLPAGSKLARYEELFQVDKQSFTQSEKLFVISAISLRDNKKKKIKRRYITLMVSLCFLAMFFAYLSLYIDKQADQLEIRNAQINEQNLKLEKQLIRNYWSTAINERRLKEDVDQFGFIGLHAASLTEDSTQLHHIKIGLKSYVHQLPIFSFFLEDHFVDEVHVDPQSNYVYSITNYNPDLIEAKQWSMIDGSMISSSHVQGVAHSRLGDKILTWDEKGFINVKSSYEKNLQHDLDFYASEDSFSYWYGGALFYNKEDQVLTWDNDILKGSLWELTEGKEVYSFRYKNSIDHAKFNYSEDVLITWSDEWYEDTVQVLSFPKGNIINVFKHSPIQSEPSITKKGDKILTWTQDGIAHLWSVNDGKELNRYVHKIFLNDHDVNHGGAILKEYTSSFGLVVTWGDDNFVKVWHMHKGDSLLTFQHNSKVNEVQFNAKGDKLLTLEESGKLNIWSLDDGLLITSFEDLNDPEGAFFVNNREEVLTWSNSEGVMYLYSVKDPIKDKTLSYKNILLSTSLSPNGKYIFNHKRDQTANIWNAKDDSLIIEFNPGIRFIDSKFSEDSQNVLTWSEDSTVRIWSVGDGALIHKFLHDGRVNGAVLNADKNFVLTWSEDSTARMWSALDGSLIHKFEHDGDVSGAVLNEDKNFVLTWSKDSIARMWSVRDGSKLYSFQHISSYGKPHLSSEGDQVITFTDNYTAKVWSANTGESVRDIKIYNESDDMIFSSYSNNYLFSSDGFNLFLGSINDTSINFTLKHDVKIGGVKFNKTGNLVLTWANEKAYLWSALDGSLLLTLDHKTEPIVYADFSLNQEKILTLSAHGYADLFSFHTHIWDIGIDRDIPVSIYRLSFEGLKGKKFNNRLNMIEKIQKENRKDAYWNSVKNAIEHFKVCKYPHQNFWARQHPEQAKKTRPEISW